MSKSLYASECREMGVRLLPPDINRSETGFTIVDGAMLYGLAAIKRRENISPHKIRTRATGGTFVSSLIFAIASTAALSPSAYSMP